MNPRGPFHYRQFASAVCGQVSNRQTPGEEKAGRVVLTRPRQARCDVQRGQAAPRADRHQKVVQWPHRAGGLVAADQVPSCLAAVAIDDLEGALPCAWPQ